MLLIIIWRVYQWGYWVKYVNRVVACNNKIVDYELFCKIFK